MITSSNVLITQIKKGIVILWWMTCFFLTVDTGLFLYPSLSQTLLGGISSLLMCIVVFVCGFIAKGHWPISKGIMLVMIWVCYIVFHAFFIEEAEHYKLYYVLVSLILLASLTFGLHNNYISAKHIEIGLLLMVILQIVCITLQLIGIKQSNNPQFIATGFSSNPNTVCILFAVMCPFIINRIKHSKYTYTWLLILFISIVYVLCLKCRTAILGATIIIIMHLLFNTKIQNWLRHKKYRLWFCGVASIVIALISIYALYQLKRDSADGRLLVWKISTNMIMEKPSGWGVGMFEKYYNLSQGEYFEHTHGTESERMLSDIVRMAYNDYLEQGVETGIVGMLFLIAFYASLIMHSLKCNNIKGLSLVCSFAVMCIVNFIYSAILPWHVLIVCSAFVLYRTDQLKSRVLNITLTAIFIFTCCVITHKYYCIATAQMELNKIKNSPNINTSVSGITKLEKQIDTSSEYYFLLADIHKRNHNYKGAIKSLEKASKYTSDTKLFFKMFSSYDMLDKTREGIQYIKTISNMLPQNMTSKYILLRWYDCSGLHNEALEVANEMVHTKLKIQNPKSLQYQKEAQYYINHYSNIQKKE